MNETGVDQNHEEDRWSQSVASKIQKVRTILIEGLLTIHNKNMKIVLQDQGQIQKQIEVSTASDIVCLSLLQKKFEEKGNSKDFNPILKKRFLENMSERQWREFFFKDQFYTISIQEDLGPCKHQRVSSFAGWAKCKKPYPPYYQ